MGGSSFSTHGCSEKMARFLLALLVLAVLASSSTATQQDKNQLGEVGESEAASQLEIPANELEQVAAEQIVERVLRSSAREEGRRPKGEKAKARLVARKRNGQRREGAVRKINEREEIS